MYRRFFSIPDRYDINGVYPGISSMYLNLLHQSAVKENCVD